MSWFIQLLIYWLTVISADDVRVPTVRGRAAGAVMVAYASLEKPSVINEDEEDATPDSPDALVSPGGPAVAPTRNCPDGRCPTTRR